MRALLSAVILTGSLTWAFDHFIEGPRRDAKVDRLVQILLDHQALVCSPAVVGIQDINVLQTIANVRPVMCLS